MIIEIPPEIEYQVTLANHLLMTASPDKQRLHYVEMFQQHVGELVCALILKKVYEQARLPKL